MIQQAENTLQVGEVLNDKWVILEFIARGGMGEVYRAHQLNLKRDVAIKIISREWLDSLEDNEEGLQSGLQRFRNEVASMAQVRHPNVLQIFDYGSVTVGGEDAPITHEYIAMEFIPGSTLRSTMSEEGFFPEEDLIREWLMDYFLPVLDGVETLHAAEIIHRDLKPENILLDGNRPKIADFGLARSKQMGRVSNSADMFGTPAYMPPEQFLDFRRTDRRSDIYALGKILYEASAGRITAKTLPFKSAELENAETPFLRCLDKIIRHSTSENKADRPGSIQDLRESLMGAVDISLGKATRCKTRASAPDEGLPTNKTSRKKWFWIAAAVILSSVLVYLSGFQSGKDSHEDAAAPVAGPTASKENSRSEDSLQSKSGVFDSSDGVAMHLIPEGILTLPEDWGPGLGGKVRVDSFYLDETQVTNLQYVDFLNRQISGLTVEAGVVRGADGKIWLLLGEVLEGYEPIFFKEGRFHVKNPVHAACPVVRVTAYGAAAYARFYGERLPTAAEWLYTLESGADEAPRTSSAGRNITENNNGTTSMMSMMSADELEMTDEPTVEPSVAKPFPYPVMLYTPDKFGIRGLNAGIGEWAVKKLPAADTANLSETYSVMGGVMDKSPQKTSLPRPLQRQPWEAFEEVGFRCAKSIVPRPE